MEIPYLKDVVVSFKIRNESQHTLFEILLE